MPSVKRDGVLVRPGKFRIQGKDEIRTIEELEEAIKKHTDGIMLTYGHAADGSPIPGATQFVGKAFPYWDSEKKAVLANYSFFDEYWDNIPEHVRSKITNKEKVPISIGYRIDDIDKDGTQKGIVFTHVAIVPEGEEPIASDVGVNVRMESERELVREHETLPNYRLESGEIPEVEETKPTGEVVKEETEYVTKADFDELKTILKTFIESNQVIKEPEPEPVQVEEKQEALPPEPEVQIPMGTADDKIRSKFVNGVFTTYSS